MMKDKKAENKPGLPWDILSPDAEADEKFISLVHEESRAEKRYGYCIIYPRGRQSGRRLRDGGLAG